MMLGGLIDRSAAVRIVVVLKRGGSSLMFGCNGGYEQAEGKYF